MPATYLLAHVFSDPSAHSFAHLYLLTYQLTSGLVQGAYVKPLGVALLTNPNPNPNPDPNPNPNPNPNQGAYVERLGVALLVNAPALFRATW